MSDLNGHDLAASDVMGAAGAAPRAAPEPPSLHNSHVDQDIAQRHLCGNVHLASGRECLLPERHCGGCAFVEPSRRS